MPQVQAETIQEVAAYLSAVIAALAVVVGAVKKAQQSVATENPKPEEKQTCSAVQELSEIQLDIVRMKATLDNSLPQRLEHIEEDIDRLFTKTDKLTDLLIEYLKKE